MNLSPLPIQKFFDNNGRPLTGGLLFTYAAGTSTKLATYADESGTPNTNPIVLNFRGEANLWLDQTLTYKFVLSPEGDTDPPTKPIWTVDNISAAVTYASLTRQIIGQILFPRTQPEITGLVVPTNYGFRADPTMEAERYGFAASASAAANTTAINSAMAGLPLVGLIRSGTVLLPPGLFNINEITVPQYVRIMGSGKRATELHYAGASWAFQLGRGGATEHGTGISDLAIVLENKDGNGVKLRETIGAAAERLYIEGYTATVTTRTNIAVGIDAGSLSTFHNHIGDVDAVHIRVGYSFLTAAISATDTLFTNCTAFGDDSTYGQSHGIEIALGQADGSVFVGGNFEHLRVAVVPAAGALGFSMHGSRFEANFVDITSGGGGQKNASFFGLRTDTEFNVSDNTNLYSFVACGVTGGGQWQNRFSAPIRGLLGAPAYSTSITPALADGNEQSINCTNGTAFAINAPTGVTQDDGFLLRLTIRNASGGALGAVTWNAIYKLAAWTQPANGNSRSIQFRYDGVNWIEVSRTTADVPN